MQTNPQFSLLQKKKKKKKKKRRDADSICSKETKVQPIIVCLNIRDRAASDRSIKNFYGDFNMRWTSRGVFWFTETFRRQSFPFPRDPFSRVLDIVRSRATANREAAYRGFFRRIFLVDRIFKNLMEAAGTVMVLIHSLRTVVCQVEGLFETSGPFPTLAISDWNELKLFV